MRNPISAFLAGAVFFVLSMQGAVAGNVFDGQIDNDTEAFGNYAVITGGLFPNGQTYNGDNASGGTMRYIHDGDPHPWGSTGFQSWAKDDWFVETSSIALTMKNNGGIVFDNNGIETDSFTENFYGDPENPSAVVPGLYCAYSMSNNLDWVYSGYFKLTEEETVVDEITGYFAETYYAPIDLSHPFKFNTNIYSAVQVQEDELVFVMPFNTGAFQGDVFSSDLVSGTHTVSDSGVKRNYSGFSDNDDIIYRLTYTLDEPIVLPAGEYFFSHDAQVVPLPATLNMLLMGGMAVGGFGLIRRRRK